jgi:hypothetical protein
MINPDKKSKYLLFANISFTARHIKITFFTEK